LNRSTGREQKQLTTDNEQLTTDGFEQLTAFYETYDHRH
jgi:hypothetical protein